MGAVASSLHRAPFERDWRLLPIMVGMLAMCLPSYVALAHQYWRSDDEAHGPIILFIVLWLLWRARHDLEGVATARARAVGVVVFGFGLILYLIGRSQLFFQLDIGSQIPLLIGLALMFGGSSALRSIWFPACFIVFLVPVPPSMLDQLLVPLKVTVSKVVTDSLYFLGYPISRSGVELFIGQYQLLIADACSGLRSMIALSGVGLLYVYVSAQPSRWRNGALIVAALPIAFLANVARVTVLVLVTYYFGDAVGRRFHELAGYFELVLAFGGFFGLDMLMSHLIVRPR